MLAFTNVFNFVCIACLHATEQLRCEVRCSVLLVMHLANGLKWTRTTDLTLIRRAL